MDYIHLGKVPVSGKAEPNFKETNRYHFSIRGLVLPPKSMKKLACFAALSLSIFEYSLRYIL